MSAIPQPSSWYIKPVQYPLVFDVPSPNTPVSAEVKEEIEKPPIAVKEILESPDYYTWDSNLKASSIEEKDWKVISLKIVYNWDDYNIWIEYLPANITWTLRIILKKKNNRKTHLEPFTFNIFRSFIPKVLDKYHSQSQN